MWRWPDDNAGMQRTRMPASPIHRIRGNPFPGNGGPAVLRGATGLAIMAFCGVSAAAAFVHHHADIVQGGLIATGTAGGSWCGVGGRVGAWATARRARAPTHASELRPDVVDRRSGHVAGCRRVLRTGAGRTASVRAFGDAHRGGAESLEVQGPEVPALEFARRIDRAWRRCREAVVVPRLVARGP